MKSHITRISTVGWNYDSWIKWRNHSGIGCSEIQYVMGLNDPKYGSNLELHLTKSGQWDKVRQDNFHTYKGHCTEDMIINRYWKYYQESPESVLINKDNPEYIKKKCAKINAILINSKYDWLFGSIDRIIPKGHISRLTGEPLDDWAILEAKNMKEVQANKFDGGIAPGFLAQTQGYLTISEKYYAELQILLDSTYPSLVAFPRSEIFIENMLESTEGFWLNVLKARELVKVKNEALLNNCYDELADIEFELTNLEPPVQSGEGYTTLLKERYQNVEQGRIELGNNEQLEWAIDLKKITLQISELEKQELLYKNKLMKSMLDNGIEELSFDNKEYVRLKKDVNGTYRFTNKVTIPQ